LYPNIRLSRELHIAGAADRLAEQHPYVSEDQGLRPEFLPKPFMLRRTLFF
jgi:hypothetical protein